MEILFVVLIAIYLLLGAGVVWLLHKEAIFPYSYKGMDLEATAPILAEIAVWVFWPIVVLVAMVVIVGLMMIEGIVGIARIGVYLFRKVAGPAPGCSK